MDFSPIREVFIFDGQTDTTFEQIRVWKGVFYSVLSANEAYLEKLQDAIKILCLFCLPDADSVPIAELIQKATRQFVDLLSQVGNFHQNVLGGLETYRDPNGPFADLNRMNSCGFQNQNDISASTVKDHRELETAAVKALEKYERQVMKRDTSPRAQTVRYRDLIKKRRPSVITQKVDEARLNFALLCRREFKHREVVLQQTKALKMEFLKEEEQKIAALFSTINVVWDKMCNVIPYHVRRPKTSAILPKDTNSLAKLGWEVHLKLYKFPEYQVDKNNIQLDREIKDIIENTIQTRDTVTTTEMPTDSTERGSNGREEISNEEHARFSTRQETHAPRVPSSNMTTSTGTITRSAMRLVTSDDQKKQDDDIKTKQTSAANQANLGTQDVVMPNNSNTSLQKSRAFFLSGDQHPNSDLVQTAFDRKTSTLGKRTTTFDVTNEASASATGPAPPSAATGPAQAATTIGTTPSAATAESATVSLPAKRPATTAAALRATAEPATAEPGPAASAASTRSTRTKSPTLSRKDTPLVMNQIMPSRNKHTPLSTSTDTGLSTNNDAQNQINKARIVAQKCGTQTTSDNKSHTSQALKTDQKKKGFFWIKKRKPEPSSGNKVTMETVMSIRTRPKQNASEISLREGMRIKMTGSENSDGMAYGYKRTRWGLKKYGYFPVNAVISLGHGSNDN